MSSTQQEYFDYLLERVRNDKYPSNQMLDRLETLFWTSDQVKEYVDLLMEKINESYYPSGQLLDRIERMLMLTAQTT